MIDFCALGIPASSQSKSGSSRLKWWRDQVRTGCLLAKQTDWQIAERVRVTVEHFYYESVGADLDNILKPILDAMKDVAYEDDKQVDEIVCRRIDLAQSPTLPGSLSIALGNRSPKDDFVHIFVEQIK